MAALHDSIRRTVARHAMCPPDARVLVAVSGGSDSVALYRLLSELARSDGFEIAGIAHFNHQLRPAASHDEALCRALAERTGCAFFTGTADVRALAGEARLSIEDSARRERYAFLHITAEQCGATRIATGHTRGDQVETFLLKLTRGAGLSGLGGIYPVRGRLIRPLLDVTRSELRSYLQASGESWVEDETNADVSNPRNRVRHVVLPQLASALGPAIVDAIARTASLAAEDGAWLDELAAERLAALAVEADDGVWMSVGDLRALPGPLLRRALLQAMKARSGRECAAVHVEAALDVLAGRARAAESPAGRWELLGEKLVLLNLAGWAAPAKTVAVPFSYELSIPGEVRVSEAGCVIGARRVFRTRSGKAGMQTSGDQRHQALIAAPDVERLFVRNRRPGDRVRLTGGGGRKKLQDLFVDAKVPRSRRDTMPLVTGPDDGVIWVPGHAVSADFRVGDAKDPVILLTFTQVGERA